MQRRRPFTSVCVFSIRECEACVNVNLTLPVLPFARRVCVCVNVNLTLPVLPFARRVCACECELDAAGVAQHGN